VSYTPSVKLSHFIVWRHAWRKNWVNCAVLTDYSASLRNVLSSRLSRTELPSSLRESHRFLSLPAAKPRWQHLKAHPFLGIHSAESIAWYIPFQMPPFTTFYAFFSSFRITLWPMWLTNNRRQPFSYPPYSHPKEDI